MTNNEPQESLQNVINEFEAACENEELGGSDLLFSLSKSCEKLAENGAYKHTMVSFILRSIFWEIGRNQRNRPLQSEECRNVYTTLYQPIIKVFNNLKEDVEEEVLIKDIENLIDIYNNLY